MQGVRGSSPLSSTNNPLESLDSGGFFGFRFLAFLSLRQAKGKERQRLTTGPEAPIGAAGESALS
jgi:hypothetical protein